MKIQKRHLLLAILALIAIWQLFSWIINRSILPSPIVVGQVFIKELQAGLIDHFLASLWRVLASTALAILIAAPLGLILGQSKRLNQVISPVIYLVYPIPKVVLSLAIKMALERTCLQTSQANFRSSQHSSGTGALLTV